LSLGFNGAAVMTSAQNPQDLAPNYAASVFGFTNFFATMSGFISPLVVSYFTSERVSELEFPVFQGLYRFMHIQSTMDEWRQIFVLDGILYIVSAVFFMIFGSGEVQKWNRRDSRDLVKGIIKV
jgi:MFS transporter, ACS family, solute carrier family 17 (sodium-dependent inorganic phosphate cotransporter), other